MMLLGEYRHTIDAKNRVFIPAKLREQLGETFVMTRKMEHCLALYSEYEWEKFAEKINTLPDSLVGAIKQFLFPKSVTVTPDSQGRIVIPSDLGQYAKLDKNAVIAGVGDHAEIWAEDLWTEKENNCDIAALTEQLRALGL